MKERGIYCLVFQNPQVSRRVGALGDVEFFSGWHIYVGSAMGSAGFSRVRRHIALSAGKNKKPRWHVDYLLTSPFFLLDSVFCGCTNERLECVLAGILGGERVSGFGCSDCKCKSHLFRRKENPCDEIMSAFVSLGIPVHMKNIK
ncbi:MAG: DUF123 domain-containing protein [Methanomicrobiaceae archaeon]|nr:DUF123 domain-containing protein [Methanomicrobiaceae archaeon]